MLRCVAPAKFQSGHSRTRPTHRHWKMPPFASANLLEKGLLTPYRMTCASPATVEYLPTSSIFSP
jgi:hypothetical protein